MKILGVNVRPALLAAMALLVPVASLAFLALAEAGQMRLRSERALLEAWWELEPNGGRPLHYLDYLPGSAVYYSRGKAVSMTGAGPESPEAEFWLAAHKTLGDVSRWECIVKFRPATGMFNLSGITIPYLRVR